MMAGLAPRACRCGKEHPWDTISVSGEWAPHALRCFIIGESPGENRAKYFYNERRKKVAIRTIMLRELGRHGLLDEPTLRAFQKAGFLFDHAIRCLLPPDTIRRERSLADRYNSPLAQAATHLNSYLGRAPAVWVMGRIARNAVAARCAEFPRDTAEISKPPYPRALPDAPRFFVSRYLLHAPANQVPTIFARLHRFLNHNAALQCPACIGRLY
ncbi:MAG: hypothetical protein ACREK6_17970 [Candidatus Rokuibacteriota bacterium]